MIHYKCKIYHNIEISSFECSQCFLLKMKDRFLSRVLCVRDNAEKIITNTAKFAEKLKVGGIDVQI